MNLTGRAPYAKGQRPQKVAAIRAASAGKTCTIAAPGICLHGTETVVGAHLRAFGNAGTGQKPDDLFIVDACAACHAALDAGRIDDTAQILRALMTTQARRRAEGLIHLGRKPGQ
jgi:hypothetical protein